MAKKIFRLLFVLCLIAVSCKSTDDEENIVEDTLEKIDLSKSSNHRSLSNYIEELKIIPLENNKNSLISEPTSIQKIIYENNKYFLFDNRFMSIKVFDTTGKYLFNIGKLGNRKGEFSKIADFIITKEQHLVVLCNSPAKIIKYDLEGNLIKERYINFFASSLAYEEPNNYIFYVNQNKSLISGRNNILITDSLFSLKAKMFPMPENIKSVIKFSGGLFNLNDKIFFNPAFTNDYYLINNSTITPIFSTAYGNNNIPKSIDETSLLENLNNYGFQYNTLTKFKSTIGFNFNDYGIKTTIFYNIENGVIVSSDPTKDSINLLFCSAIFQKENSIVCVLDLNQHSKFILRHKKEIKDNFPKFFDNTKLGDTIQNLALAIYSLRNY